MISLPIITTIISGFWILMMLIDIYNELKNKANPKVKADWVVILIFAWFIVSTWTLYYN